MDNDIVNVRFIEWTKGLDPVKARMSVFEHIRDIPYAIIPELRDPYTGPAGMLKLNKGSCVPKHFLLGLLFAKMGIQVKYASYLFAWDDKGVAYTPALRQLTKEMPITAHLAIKACIENKWVLIDATWDLPLRKYGFPVNVEWNGFIDCKNAVTPIKEIIHGTMDERVRYSDERRGSYTEREKKAYEMFTAQLNDWLARIRRDC